jgi:hypothetical protein
LSRVFLLGSRRCDEAMDQNSPRRNGDRCRGAAPSITCGRFGPLRRSHTLATRRLGELYCLRRDHGRCGWKRPVESIHEKALAPLPRVTPTEQAKFSELVIAAFGLRRKQMRRVVRTLAELSPDVAEQILNAAGIDAESRPETLTPKAFVSLFRRMTCC